ncbi:uncharacterized protein STEHIDRAFT_86345 [Stereum hirsutum FP-91666 SS1]|uniref:uncharacterized protein n=1 Tax=Stereum hirsutum (strain FP-91666) TaxID=721885 RepID=UPI000444A430|nr:uncharacterized protein STEHIDRAFT_86345 [Stereum hirsutum FP-91666 SS1]EIM81079.1 hypothetical protein STEHIDRAFT_86345 [Stereum hirsutum FP-91666 SS1]
MSSVAGRKKSIISSAAVQIDIPVAHNTLLNQSASQSTSLYQRCAILRARLLTIDRFSEFFQLSAPSDSSRRSTDPVTQVWDCLAIGAPLCYLFNLLPPPYKPIEGVDPDPSTFNIHDERLKKRAIAFFSMRIHEVPDCEGFKVTDLSDRDSTDGFVKIIQTITILLDALPESVFTEVAPPSPPMPEDSTESLTATTPSVPVPANAQEAARNNIIKEIVETERKYVQDLEVMQTYAQALSQSSTIDQDTIHLLFPNLNKLLNFQRKFLIRVEGTAELPWKDMRWGILFTENEEEFAVYEPYCANYTNASELMLMEEQNLQKFNHVINAKSELPAFLIKPVQRICKYPLLLDSLLKAIPPAEYPYYDELKEGSAAAKRITDKINEAQRRAENQQTVQNLASRVDDWKGHHVTSFGELLLDNIFIVTKSEVDREYHVFLFERIILCCKEDPTPGGANGKKVGKSNSILKKPQTPTASQTAPGVSGAKKKTTPLLLKGRIYLNNVTDAKSIITAGTYSLNVWWKGDDDLEYFTLRCRNEEQVKLWENSIKRLIERLASRRASERAGSRTAFQAGNSTNPAALRLPPQGYNASDPHQKQMSISSNLVPSLPPHPYGNGAARAYSRQSNPYGGGDEQPMFSPGGYGTVNGPAGYPPHDGFDADDDYEDYPPVMIPSSGRATPLDSRRGTVPAMPSASSSGTNNEPERTRAYTEDVNGAVLSQWRNNNHASHGSPNLPSMAPPLSMSMNGLPMAPRPSNPRLNSTMSAASFVSNSSFGQNDPRQLSGSGGMGGGGSPVLGGRPMLKSQFSSTKLRQTYEGGSGSGSISAAGSDGSRSGAASPQISNMQMPGMPNPHSHHLSNHPHPHPHAHQHHQHQHSQSQSHGPLRSRSASQPSAYVPRNQASQPPPPPLPTTGAHGWTSSSSGSAYKMSGESQRESQRDRDREGKRSSGSSHSSSGGENKSEYSPNSSSPITPFGSNDSVGFGSSRTSHGGPLGENGNGYANGNGNGHTSRIVVGGVGAGKMMPPPTSAASANGGGVAAGLVKVKVHFGNDIFVIQVPRTTEYHELVEKVGRKIRLCGGRREDGPLRVKYEDEEGDMISMRSTEDVDMAFGGKTSVTLHVA